MGKESDIRGKGWWERQVWLTSSCRDSKESSADVMKNSCLPRGEEKGHEPQGLVLSWEKLHLSQLNRGSINNYIVYVCYWFTGLCRWLMPHLHCRIFIEKYGLGMWAWARQTLDTDANRFSTDIYCCMMNLWGLEGITRPLIQRQHLVTNFLYPQKYFNVC